MVCFFACLTALALRVSHYSGCVRSGSVPRRPRSQVHHPQPFHIPAFQRRPTDMLGATGRRSLSALELNNADDVLEFAYHETSFFLIRLLQQFSSISHVLEAQPPSSRSPPEWKNAPGTKGTDKVRIKSYLTMSMMVRFSSSSVVL